MKIVNYRPINKGSMQGQVTVETEETVEEIVFIKHTRGVVMMSNGRRWVNLPQEKYTDKEGKEKYAKLVSVEGEGQQFKYSDLVIKYLDAWIKKYPNGLPKENNELPKKAETNQPMGYDENIGF